MSSSLSAYSDWVAVGRPANCGSSPRGAEDASALHGVQTGSGALSASYLTRPGGFPGVKAACGMMMMMKMMMIMIIIIIMKTIRNQ
jgi:hypothetical protein